ncbi:hypothetical protein RHMOL_Rhmol01G0238500 [Rhododendron molle]|uniref:Uncharacterized protein n=1 Tax=Rhododendron molle TaxID=49168 RepID=A0ACC0Q5C0_RHOML|nr:hypothetical protein RHMOL_Rhmol01G0238500 [Rhododendron molle]
MKHSQARNVVERSFGVLNMRFTILKCASYYPISTQCHIVTACCLVHDLIKREISIDPIEAEYMQGEQDNLHNVEVDDNCGTVGASNEWTAGKDALATAMFNNWLGNGGGLVGNI